MATQLFYRIGMLCAIVAFVLMFVSFASPFWYKSWTRVHSPFANIGLWHVCMSGFIMPRDPNMKSYVGCWWIHSSEFELVANQIMPAWFRIIQMLCVFTVVLDLVGMVLLLLYLLDGPRGHLYDKDKGKMFIIDSILMLTSAFLVFLISLIFAEKSNDGDWMPRPWMNYLSWSYGLCVLSGFFAAFGGMVIFILGLIFKDKDRRELDTLDSAAELRRHQEAAREKEEEAMSTSSRSAAGGGAVMHRGPYHHRQAPTHIPHTRFSSPSQEMADRNEPAPAKQPPRVGESFV